MHLFFGVLALKLRRLSLLMEAYEGAYLDPERCKVLPWLLLIDKLLLFCDEAFTYDFCIFDLCVFRKDDGICSVEKRWRS